MNMDRNEDIIGGVAIGAILAAIALTLFAGCNTTDKDRIQREIDRLKPDTTETTPDTTPTTTQPPAPVTPPSLQGDQTFLWKPAGESTGKLVILLPARILSDKCIAGTEWGADGGRHNGNRHHWRFKHPGAQYGRNVLVVSYYQGAETGRWTVPDGGQRKTFSGWRRMMFWRGEMKEDA
jgi:hypothetical protein